MKTENFRFGDARLDRALRKRIDDRHWRVKDAKAQLNELLARARDGTAQLVGQRNPVIFIGMKELESLMNDLNRPETWGEYFHPHPRPGGLGVHLEVPPSDTSVADSYDLDSDYGRRSSEVSARYPGSRLLATIAGAYMRQGDFDAVGSILSVIERAEGGGYTLGLTDQLAAVASDYAFKDLAVGQHVKAKVVRREKSHIVLEIEASRITAPAFIGSEMAASIPLESTVDATVISTPERHGAFAFSVRASDL